MNSAYDEAIDFLARGMTAEQLVAFQPSAEASARFEWLIEKEKKDGLLPEEREELDRWKLNVSSASQKPERESDWAVPVKSGTALDLSAAVGDCARVFPP